jgi:outer membrane immunogenic protein
MRNGLIGAVAVVALTVTDAGAADYRLPYRPPPCGAPCAPPPMPVCGQACAAPPPPPPPPCGQSCAPPPCGVSCGPPAYVAPPCECWNWAGFYGGANAGFQWGTLSNSGAKPSGVLGGFQGGYNWQFGEFVAGFETDIQLSDANDVFAGYKFSNPWFGTARGRGGYAYNNMLFYGTLGLAYGLGRIDFNGMSESNLHVGWTTGFGMEMGLSRNWSVKAEYLFVDLTSATYLTTHTSNALTSNVARIGVNFHY